MEAVVNVLTVLKNIIWNSSKETLDNMSEDQLFKKLKIISKIPENGKLSVAPNETISVENDTNLQGLSRYISGNSRDRTIKSIKMVIKQSCNLADTLMESKWMEIYQMKREATESEVQEHERRVDKLKMLRNEMNKSKVGLGNLKDTTYKDDSGMESDLEIVLREIDAKIEEINSTLHRCHDRHVKKEEFIS